MQILEVAVFVFVVLFLLIFLYFLFFFFFFKQKTAYEIGLGIPAEPLFRSSGDLQERVLIRHHDYDQCFQSVQLLQWNSQVKFNVTVYRNLPTTRDSIMTS